MTFIYPLINILGRKLERAKYSKIGGLTPVIDSQAKPNLWYGYLKINGSTGALDKNAPVLNGRRNSPLVVVPSVEEIITH